MLIGAERQHKLFTIDTNGVATPFEFEGEVEDIELIPSGQNLYCIDVGPGGPNGRILKVASSNFSDYIGDLLITIEGDEGDTPRLAIVHWDGANFVVRDIVNNGTPGVTQFEHVTFAPF